MSFSVTYIGRPDAIKRRLATHSEELTGQSKEEFDAVLPSMNRILDQNVGGSALRLEANGHASFADGKKTYGACQVSISILGPLAE